MDAGARIDGGDRELRADARVCSITRARSSRQDIFVPAVSQYAAFRGPGKLEGSVVNWLNGPVFQLVGERAGFPVTVKPFDYREGSSTVVLQARPRDAYTSG